MARGRIPRHAQASEKIMCEFPCATVLRFVQAGVSYRLGAKGFLPWSAPFEPGTASGFSFRNMRTLKPRLACIPDRVRSIDPRFASSGVERIRGSQLQRIRLEHFQRNPLCVECDKRGEVRLATELDHIVALCNGGRDIESNRQGLCGPCHALKTQRDIAQSVNR